MDIQHTQKDSYHDSWPIEIGMMLMPFDTRDHTIGRAHHQVLRPILRKSSLWASEEGIDRQQHNAKWDQNRQLDCVRWIHKKRDADSGSEDTRRCPPFADAMMRELDNLSLVWRGLFGCSTYEETHTAGNQGANRNATSPNPKTAGNGTRQGR